ncbi:TPA: hypothetical protein ACHTCR_005156 [Pseudomonas putida]|jgi:hypothetical protein|uniref:Uncharacterized protein n=1 Tax=Pseudomonas putida (strain GB-1) TaxID=76869 RepID=B0KKE0_PSEPG|nr:MULTISPECIES: hypothetical protein [Pseudomonas]ABY97846.1 hypothetical protein PputGB1_1943 [Pseudomonas putida GB-1]APE98218.1 hypothetical protein BG030_09370 [Pseudomonas putida]MBP0709960.1 hypothetical protein [Pseudomonas sp. T34]MCE1003448.1 hypothetical protein [Pseudomonas sp. NMI1173_11]MCK2189407.1 hypothetical protein [Pseudomonas sp. MB04B]
MKAVLGIGAAIAIAVAGWFGWNHYESGKEHDVAAAAVQVSVTQAERQMKAQSEDGITFAEYFKRSDTVIDNLDKEIANLEGRTWKHRLAEKDAAIAFIDQCKAILRADQTETRLLMKEGSAREANDEAKKELNEADSSVAREWAYKRYKRTSDALIDVLGKLISNAEESKGKIERMLAADNAVKSTFGEGHGLSQGTAEHLKNLLKPAAPEKPAQS